MEPEKKRGRPRLPDGEAKGVFPLRLSARERDLFAHAAHLTGETLPEWMRKTLTIAAQTIIGNTESGARGNRTPGASDVRPGAAT